MLNIISGMCEVFNYIVLGIFGGIDTVVDTDSEIYRETLEYWENLNFQDQEYYFNNNEYLKDYLNLHYYPNNKYITAEHVAKLACKLNRKFTNKYSSY